MYKEIDASKNQQEEVTLTPRRRRRSMMTQVRNLFTFTATGDKPQSNPNNWPYSNEDDILDRPKRVIRIGIEQSYSFCDNFVKTSKYEAWNFIPKFLLEEFDYRTKVANCYFIMIAGLQCIPAISNTNGVPTYLIPLLVVVTINALLQISEDISRHRADATANSSPSEKLDRATGEFIGCKWSEIHVGDFIRIETRKMVPADVLIISVAEKSQPAQGLCYVETKSLDGETNLKIRQAIPCTLDKIKSAADLMKLTGDVEMEHPNKLIDSFMGTLDLGQMGREAILPGNVLLRGCVLRNTDWIFGLVLNTGHDTKIMMSSTATKTKASNLEVAASKEIKRIIMLLGFVCFIGATGQAVWNEENDVEDIRYLGFWDPNPVGFWFIKFFYFFLLHATFIPVSLYVSMSIVRSTQKYFMDNDLDMYYPVIDEPAKVRTMTLNEELGQVSHIFSDKTGTLTCNIMDYRKSSINGVSYGEGITEIGRAAWKLQGRPISPEILKGEEMAKANAVPHVSFYCPEYEKDMKEGGPQKTKNQNFYRVLAICHNVIPEHALDGTVKLSASNSDDEALVCAAAYFGFEFCDRHDKFCVIKRKDPPCTEEVEVLQVIEFSSKRKRMSVIIRDNDGSIKLLCKGADTMMLPRLRKNQAELIKKTENDMREFAVEGLRCLIIGQSIIKEEIYKKWADEYRAATTDLNQLDLRKKGEPNTIEDLEDQMEQELEILGATAIEDRLQDGVPDCIAELAAAGINIWVLTGDKEETAINIAVACNLVLPKEYMDHIIVNLNIAPTVEDMKQLFLTEIQRYDNELLSEGENATALKPRALIIDGPALILAMADTTPDGLKELLLDISQRCKAVVGCRVSPDQKREMVNLIKTGVEGVRTLAVGDGANDVAMIQEAHIGVGIKGEEGVQAVNSADFAIAQFRFLSDLMLKHGRFNYIRTSNLVCYIFYKNILMSVAQFWFNFSCAFSGQKYYTEGAIQLYNLAYTSIPILLYGTYDMDVSPKFAHYYPQLYLAGINDDYFKPTVFWSWIMSGLVESTIISVLPLFTLSNSGPNDGIGTNFSDAGMTCFSAIVIIANLKLLFIQSRWYTWSIIVLLGSILVYFASIFFITSFVLLDFDFYYTFIYLTNTGAFWLTLLLLVTLALIKDIYITGLERSFNFKPYHIIQEMETHNVEPGADEEINDDDIGDNKIELVKLNRA